MMACPHCEQKPPYRADLDGNRIYVNGRWIKAHPTQVEVFSALLDAYPNNLTYDDIAQKLWGATGGPDNAAQNIRVQVYQLRKTLGVSRDIITNSQGYKVA